MWKREVQLVVRYLQLIPRCCFVRLPDDGLSKLSRRLELSLLIVNVWKCCGCDVDSGGSTVRDGRDDSLHTASTIESIEADRGKRLFAAFSRLCKRENQRDIL